MGPTAVLYGRGISRFTGVRILNLAVRSGSLYRLDAIVPT